MTFNFDATKIPAIKPSGAYFEANGWFFDADDESGLAYVENAVYAWIAWHQFINSQENTP